MIYDSLFGFKTKSLERGEVEYVNTVDFFSMAPVQCGPFSDGSEAQGFMSEEFVVCQLFGQPCYAGSCRGFCAHQQLPQQESQSGLLRSTSFLFGFVVFWLRKGF